MKGMSGPRSKAAQDKLTLLLNGNISGTLKLNPILGYHSETSRAMRGLNKWQLFMYLKSNRKAWVTTGTVFLLAYQIFKQSCVQLL